ncbi:MAG: hypothetical protein HFH05_01220 [Lachnospiraceae bacterium]|nr:hypothetical protein [Lachnospiraceae bacterium]MCI9675198.1 hypothetical protein [Lachnospiraceae bacterium]
MRLAGICCHERDYGYFSGAAVTNRIGLTTQMPAILEIITSKESTKGRTATVGFQTVLMETACHYYNIGKYRAAELSARDVSSVSRSLAGLCCMTESSKLWQRLIPIWRIWTG